MNYDESNSKTLQKTLQNLEKVIKTGDFYIEKLEENLIGQNLSEIPLEILQKNLITINLTLTLRKIPGKELNTNTSNLVNSTIIEEPKNSSQNLTKNNNIINFLNDYMASKVNFVINEKKNDIHFDNLKEELLNELILDERLKEDINSHMLKLMESNLNNMEIFNDKIKKSVINNNNPNEFNDVINNYFQSKINFIFLNTKNSLIKEVQKQNPKVSQILLDNYINTKINQKNDIIKSQILTHFQKNDNNLQNIKNSIIDNFDDEQKINELVNDYLNDTLFKLDYDVDGDVVEGGELGEKEKEMVDEFLEGLVKRNFMKDCN